MARTKKATGAANGAGKKRGGKRKSQAEAMTEAKANEVETSPVLDLKPIEIDERDFDLHYNAIKAAKDKEQTAKSLRMTCEKRCKEAGEDVFKMVKDALAMDRADPEDVKRELQRKAWILKKRESPIQISLHNVLLGDVNEHAYKLGCQDGENGRPSNCTYPEGSDLAAEYARGWRDGMAKNVSMTDEQREALKEEELDTENPFPDRLNSDPPHSADMEASAEF